MTEVVRITRETNVRVEIVKDSSATKIATTIPFLDHMMITFARYAGFGLRVTATGDLPHHISE
ncbi:MAG: imidazoleglycerol-phosphate dehydratase, partial [Gemmatimonadaceae bacterium]